MTKLLHGNEKNRLNGGREPLFSQKELLVLAIPLLVEQLLEVTVGMADTMMVSRCGEAAISGVSLVDMINNLIIVLFAALATGGAVVVSQYLGAKERGNADKSAGQLLLLSGLSGVVIGGGLWWYTLSTLVNIFRKKFRLRVLITINRVSGVVITVLGGLVILAAFEPFRSLLPAA